MRDQLPPKDPSEITGEDSTEDSVTSARREPITHSVGPDQSPGEGNSATLAEADYSSQSPASNPQNKRKSRKKKIFIIALIILGAVIALVLAVLEYGPGIYKDYKMKQYGEEVRQIQLTNTVHPKNWLSDGYKNGFGTPFELGGDIIGASSDRTHIAYRDDTPSPTIHVMDVASREIVSTLEDAREARLPSKDYYSPSDAMVPITMIKQSDSGASRAIGVLDLDTLEVTTLLDDLHPAGITSILSYDANGHTLIYDNDTNTLMQFTDYAYDWEYTFPSRVDINHFRKIDNRYYFRVTPHDDIQSDSPITDPDSALKEPSVLVAMDALSGSEIFSKNLDPDDALAIFTDGFLVAEQSYAGGITIESSEKNHPGTFYDAFGAEVAHYDDVPRLMMNLSPKFHSGVDLLGSEIVDKYRSTIDYVDTFTEDGKPIIYSAFWGSKSFVETGERIPGTVHSIGGSSADGSVSAVLHSVDDDIDNHDYAIALYSPSGEEIDAVPSNDYRIKVSHGFLVSNSVATVMFYPPK